MSHKQKFGYFVIPPKIRLPKFLLMIGGGLVIGWTSLMAGIGTLRGYIEYCKKKSNS